MNTPPILITGGAGSLGKEFVRYLSNIPEKPKLVIIDNNEWAIAEFRSEFPDIDAHLGDIRLLQTLANFSVVIHCAAYKHIELGEENVMSFIENNLLATMDLYKALAGRTNRILYISTDKAVEPTSTYGFTKALAERLTWEVGGQVARCGNFLMSSGSVIPIWEKQIAEKKPLTITNPKMRRYVIEMPDAVEQIWKGFTENKSLIIPSMKEMSVLELLAEVLNRHGLNLAEYKPGIIDIGKRPGEKVREKLKWSNEK